MRSRKTALLIAQRIVEEITSKQLPPGAMLPAEKDMLATYEVGRGTLRESLRFLEMNGVITIRPGPGGGPAVCDPDSRDLAGSLGLFLQLHGTPFRSIVEVRRTMEPAIAAVAASNVEPRHLDRLRESVESMEQHLEDEEMFLAENERFHELVAWASGNPMFALLISSLHWITDGAFLGVDYPERTARCGARGAPSHLRGPGERRPRTGALDDGRPRRRVRQVPREVLPGGVRQPDPLVRRLCMMFDVWA